MKPHRFQYVLMILALLITSCNMPGFGEQLSLQVQATLTALALESATPTASPLAPEPGALTPTATMTLPAATACTPTVTAGASPVNVRSGPGTVYGSIDALAAGATATVVGKNADGTWWVIKVV